MTGSKGRHSTGAPCSLWVKMLELKIVGDSGTSPEATNPDRAAPDIFCTLMSWALSLSRNSRPMASMSAPTHCTPVVVPAIDIFPFHLGSRQSLIDFGASAGGMSLVLNPKLI